MTDTPSSLQDPFRVQTLVAAIPAMTSQSARLTMLAQRLLCPARFREVARDCCRRGPDDDEETAFVTCGGFSRPLIDDAHRQFIN